MHWVEKCQVTVFKTVEEQKSEKHEIIIMMSPCRNYSKIPNMPLKYIYERVHRKGIWTTYDIFVWLLSAFPVGRVWGCCKTCFWLFSNSLVVRVSVQMPSLIYIRSARVGWPWDVFASTSVSCCQPWKSAEDHMLLHGLAIWTWDFISGRPAWD